MYSERDIKVGEAICISYTPSIYDGDMRDLILQRGYSTFIRVNQDIMMTNHGISCHLIAIAKTSIFIKMLKKRWN